MRKFKESFLREVARFETCQDGAAPTEIGLEQFFNKESNGAEPAIPDPYFVRLLNGKRWWEWTVNYYAEMYDKFEWPGWLQLEEDFKKDPSGLQQIRQRVGLRVGDVALGAKP